MVVKMMKWRPWPPLFTKKFQVNLTLHCLEGLPALSGKSDELGNPSTGSKSGELGRVMVNVKWIGSKGLGSRFRSFKRAKTTEKVLEENCIVNWEEEFEHVCTLLMAKDNAFLPWEIHFVILQVGAKSKMTVLGSAIMNLADFASPTENAKQTTKVRVLSSEGAENQSSLLVTVNFLESRTNESSSLERFMAPTLPCISGQLPWSKSDQLLQEEADEKELIVITPSLVYGKKKAGELDAMFDGKLSPRSDQSSGDSGDPFTSDSVDDSEEGEIFDEEDCHFQSYGSLTGVNLVVEGALPFEKANRKGAERTLSMGSIASIETLSKAADESGTSDSDQGITQPTMRSLLSWKKRKLSFRSRQARGEPLLNKAYGEDGGDYIDYVRRLSGLPIDPAPALCLKGDDGTQCALDLDFGEENFSVGSWQKQDLVSRDGQTKLSANVFFASIDQRSERAAGKSACTALVAVIADWLHQNPDRMPIKAEFDTLIREGSAEWRKLCEIEAFRDRFPDGHFDLDTVLEANVRPLVVAPEKSFIGFFQPEGVGDSCSFLQGAMSFDSIWESIWEEKLDGSLTPAVFIVSWNDHFFVLKVEKDAFYIIDTLGERLYEGCNQAYILCFDKETSLCHMPKAEVPEQGSSGSSSSSGETPLPPSAASSTPSATHPQLNQAQLSAPSVGPTAEQTEAELSSSDGQNAESSVVYTGKDACKQFVKGFFAALPLRELQIDIKKGLLGKAPLHQRLQIEFHFTSLALGQSSDGS